jgi:protein-S-isoprenylcysteine O-methyltransferase Ste14
MHQAKEGREGKRDAQGLFRLGCLGAVKFRRIAKLVMERSSAILGSAIFLVVAPGTIAVYLPWTICHWRFAPPLLGFFSFRIAGVLMIGAGLPVLLDSFARFASEGLGTPAPVVPPKCLLVSGLYRYVRNPMYVALSLMIFGQGLLFGSVGLLEYGVVVWLGFFMFVVLYEEPTLRGKFGKEYEEYCARVPRWIPRLKPLRSDDTSVWKD